MNSNPLMQPPPPAAADADHQLLVNSHTHNNILWSTIEVRVITSSCTISSLLYNLLIYSYNVYHI